MLNTSVPFMDGRIEVTVDYPGYIDADALSAEGARYVQALLASIPQAKDFAADDLLDTYNQNWRQAGNPELSRAQFCDALRLTALQVLDEPGAVSAIFSDGDMFGGHAVVVEFEEAAPSYVMLFG
jgi:hypothetical protein